MGTWDGISPDAEPVWTAGACCSGGVGQSWSQRNTSKGVIPAELPAPTSSQRPCDHPQFSVCAAPLTKEDCGLAESPVAAQATRKPLSIRPYLPDLSGSAACPVSLQVSCGAQESERAGPECCQVRSCAPLTSRSERQAKARSLQAVSTSDADPVEGANDPRPAPDLDPVAQPPAPTWACELCFFLE